MDELLVLGKLQENLYSAIDSLVKVGTKISLIHMEIENFYVEHNLEIIPKTNPVTINKNNIVYHDATFEGELNDGDILTVDTCFSYGGKVIDGAKTYTIGSKYNGLRDVSRDVIIEVLNMLREGVKVSQVLNCISDYVSIRGYYLFPDGIGHGLSKKLHTNPYLSLNYFDDFRYVFKKGDYFTIEPIIFLYKDEVQEGRNKVAKISSNNVSSQFEVSVLIDSMGFPKVINSGLLK